MQMKTQSSQGPKKSQSPFQELINSSINKVKECYPEDQLQQFNELLNQQQPKKLKQLNIDPYLFVFEHLFSKEESIPFALKMLNVNLCHNQLIIDQNYCSKNALIFFVNCMSKCMEKNSVDVINIILKINEPSLQLFDLFFEIYSTVLLPEDIARRFRNLGYLWLIRIFRLKETKIPLYFKAIIDKIGVFEVPPLISQEQDSRQLQTYVHKILNNVLNKVEDKLDIEMGSSALVVRKQKKGKYLYCFMCQKPADYYCKDTKVPVCGSQCKKDHLLYISQVNVVNEHFSQEFKSSIEYMLLNNWYTARSPSLSVDYLIAIYIFSTYKPKFDIQHCKIVRSPIMMQKVWLLYSAFYQKRQEMFEHVFISFLESPHDYLEQIGRFYFLEISLTHRILEIYYNFDLKGRLKLFPIIMKRKETDNEYCSIFITNVTEMIFQNLSFLTHRPFGNITLSGELIDVFNESEKPIEALQKYFPQIQGITSDEQIAWFLLKNESQIKKQKFTKILDKDEQFISKFLKAITIRRAKCTIDELLREIFYFINVNVSEKIYRLLELLYDVYDFDLHGNEAEKKAIKKDDALFQYMYMIIMINTELHNPNLQKKPSVAEVIERISVINKVLALQHPEIIQAMFQRIKTLPFSQESRGILEKYQRYPLLPVNMVDFYLPLIILENHPAIFQTFNAIPAPNAVLYRICTILSPFPQVCSIFFKILLERLQKQQIQDEYILQAIRNIIQEQPNAVSIEGGWSTIFAYIKESERTRKKLSKSIATQNNAQSETINKKSEGPHSATSLDGGKRRKIFEPFNINNRPSTDGNKNIIWLDLQSVLVASPLLKHDNFIFFFKDFIATFPLDNYQNEYEKAIYMNKNRLNSMANSFMSAFRKAQNVWVQLSMIQFISNLQEVELEVESNENLDKNQKDKQTQSSRMQRMKNQLILLMLKEIQINDVTEYLLLETIISLSNSTNFRIQSELWECITHLALKFKSEQNQSIVEDLMKMQESCQQYYESLMIQKTLNSTQPQLINKDVLNKLDKLQPYLSDLSDKVLKMFVLKQNMQIIERNIDKFYNFDETFNLFAENYDSILSSNDLQKFLVTKIQNAIQDQLHLSSLLQEGFVIFLLKIYQTLSENQESELIIKYCHYLSLCISVTSFDEKVILDKSVIFYQASKQIIRLCKGLEGNIPFKKSVPNWLKQPITLLIDLSESFNAKIDYRRQISQTFTFKHIIAHYQKETHSPYLISLTKQVLCCKKILWIISKLQKNEFIEFVAKEVTMLTNSYCQIASELVQFNLIFNKITDHKVAEDKFLALRQKTLIYRAKLSFGFKILVDFESSRNEMYKNQVSKQFQQKLNKIRHELFVKLLFSGVMNVQGGKGIAKSGEKKHYVHNQEIKFEPLSEYLHSMGELSQKAQDIVQGAIQADRRG